MAGPSLLRAAFVCAAMLLLEGSARAAGLATGEWNFTVLLDGDPIGQHRFRVVGHGGDREVTSEADFLVKFLGITAYHYHHAANETWRTGCLASVVSRTDDDGKASHVRLERQGEQMLVGESPTARPLEGCVMSFAYWNPAIRSQSHLLNAQTGELDAVRVSPLPAATIQVHGTDVPAAGFRIAGPAAPIDVWYAADGAWIGLDSVVGGGRKLSYRLP